jgi:hypothetical protein
VVVFVAVVVVAAAAAAVVPLKQRRNLNMEPLLSQIAAWSGTSLIGEEIFPVSLKRL